MNSLFALAGGSVLAAIFAFFAARTKSRASAISAYQELPTLKDLTAGTPVVATGTATAVSPLQSPVTRRPCVYYSYSVEVERQQRDSAGNLQTSWEPLGTTQTRQIPFTLQDASGSVGVNPDRAQIDSPEHNEQLGGTGFAGGLLNMALTNTFGGQERVREDAFFTDTPVTVFGCATADANGALTFSTSKEYPLIISTKNKTQLVKSKGLTATILYVCAAVSVIAGIALAVS